MSILLFGIAAAAACAAIGGFLSLDDLRTWEDPARPGAIARIVTRITAFVAIALVAVLVAIDAPAIVLVLAIIAAVLSGFALSIYIQRTATKPLIFYVGGNR